MNESLHELELRSKFIKNEHEDIAEICKRININTQLIQISKSDFFFFLRDIYNVYVNEK